MFLTPALLFLLVWIVPLATPYFIQASVIEEVSTTTQWLVFGCVLAFFALQWMARLTAGKPRADLEAHLRATIDPGRMERTTMRLFKLWMMVYAVNIVFSGGVPIVWALTGDPRTYADFGLPTLGGLGNMLRAFVLSACYLIYFHLGTPHRRRFLGIGVFLLFTGFIVETGRGNGVVLLLHPVGFYFLLRRISIGRAVLWIFLALLFAMFLGYIQALRYGGSIENLVRYANNTGFEDADLLALLLIPSLLYVSVPIINTDLNVNAVAALQFEPYYSFQGIIPTVLRDLIFEPKDYGLLVNEAHNVSSFFIPFVRDFGVVGAFLAVTLIHAIVCRVYARARKGSLFHIFVWPPLFMSITLSFFSLFYTALVVLLYPFLTAYFVKRVTLPASARRGRPLSPAVVA